MNAAAPATRFGAPLRWLHWIMALAIFSALAFVYAKGLFAKGSAGRDFLDHAHVFAGFTVLALLPLRVLARVGSPQPPIDPPPGPLAAQGTKWVHALLYAGMLATPVLGILSVQAAGKEIAYLGYTIPTWIGTNKALSHGLKEVHETLGLGMLYLVVAHAGAAILHHTFRHDNTLRRML